MPVYVQNPDPRSLVERPADDLLAPATRMGAVELLVRDLEAMISFYSDGMTLEVLEQVGDTAVLGRAGRPIVRMRRMAELPPKKPGQAGLFHTAVLYDDEPSLAAAVASVAQHAPSAFTGSSDHLYSQAFYFDDPEGNGVEMYADRPRETWATEAHGLLKVATNPLDPNAFLRTHLAQPIAGPPPATLGHVHLQVGDIGVARDFYVDALGFEVRSDVGSALFIAAGGYHHHIAVNTWGTAGAGARAAALGLGQVNIDLPTDDDVAALQQRLADHRVDVRHDGAVLRFDDPWGTLIQVGVDAR
ncbi:VOC family protein [Rhodococcus sp. IEGM 1408]|uniref:VOC family protein n=1 Tax=Rhodococcus sp. IEGM 1408 TaxID=3082220 RepID=UPI002953CB44|nr:VOC family protein [Rhodococcus sp. IEGM 1408]MDV8002012.1 VOC family protein [Rhodococcus sp. IEGM 1408]